MALKVSSKGQVTLPKRIREALSIEPGEGALSWLGWAVSWEAGLVAM